jgi:hypothetical protein
LGTEAYSWCWAAARFLDSHPRYRDRFRALKGLVLEPRFNDVVRRKYADDWAELAAEWESLIATLEYGYDFDRMAIEFEAKRQAPGPGAIETTIAADRGWQSAGAWLREGVPYRIVAGGRYQVAVEEADDAAVPWPCEPGGVTIEYHDGRPLGMLLGAIDGRSAGATLAEAFAVGTEATITPAADGVLYLRINDSPARLDDNRGSVTATIERASRNGR